MRFAISSFSRRAGRLKANSVCAFVRDCKSDFEQFTPHVRDLSKKQAVTSESLEKIENAAYAVAIRGSEYDLPVDMLDDIVAQCIADVSKKGSNRKGNAVGGNDGDYDYDTYADRTKA